MLLVIGLLSGVIQLYFMNQHIKVEINDQANLLSQGVEQGISETNLASNGIEYQIDSKMAMYSKYIATLLKGRQLDQISQGDLDSIRDQLGLAGITLFAQRGNDIVGVKATDPAEVGFSFKKIGYLQAGEALLHGQQVKIPGSPFSQGNLIVLPIAQSGSHQGKPSFFKYAYYHVPGSSYIIDPYIQANEVYQFTNSVGPNAWISHMKQSNSDIEEIAVLNPKVFADPSLATRIYPPLKKVVFGSYTYGNSQDTSVLKKMITDPQKVTYTQRENGHRVYKVFLPIKNGQVLYVALNYDKLSQPIYRLSIVLIVLGLVGSIVLFMITARFFSRIYDNIHKIKSQIKRLETRDFTARSEVKDGGELTELSESTNRMVETLQVVLRDTGEQAKKTQRFSVLLESDSSQTMEKVYALSMKETTDGRAAADEFMYFLDQVEAKLKGNSKSDDLTLLDEIDEIRRLMKERTESTTDMTLTLSDLLKSLHDESRELSGIANSLLQNLSGFKL